MFFYNPSSRTSVWERPEDLLGRADVDKAVSTVPEQLVGKDVVKENSGNQDKLTGEVVKIVNKKESSDEEEVPQKKMKVEVAGKLIF